VEHAQLIENAANSSNKKKLSQGENMEKRGKLTQSFSINFMQSKRIVKDISVTKVLSETEMN